MFKRSKFSEHVAESTNVCGQFNHELIWEGEGREEKRRIQNGRPRGCSFPMDSPPSLSLVKMCTIVGLRSQRTKLCWLRYHISKNNCLDLALGFNTIVWMNSSGASQPAKTCVFESENLMWNTKGVEALHNPRTHYHQTRGLHPCIWTHSYKYFFESSGLCQLDLNVRVGRCLWKKNLKL